MDHSPVESQLLGLVERLTGDSGDVPARDRQAWHDLHQGHLEVTSKVRADASAWTRLTRLFTEPHQVPESEVRWCIEYLYSHVVLKCQGLLAEFLAQQELAAWLSLEVAAHRLGPQVLLASGESLRVARPGSSGTLGDRGPDALLMVERDTSLLIVGVVEIKSFPTTFRSVETQFGRHCSRLRHGFRLGKRTHAEDAIRPGWWDTNRGWQEGRSAEDWDRVLQVLVSPPRRLGSPPIECGPVRHRVDLPVCKKPLATTAFTLSVRFLEDIARQAFAAGSPWPEMSPEEAGTNAVIEALYHILHEDRPGSRHARLVATRLYNVYGFGYAAGGSTRDMLWVEDRGSPSQVKDVLEGAWTAYRRADLESALALAQEAIALDDAGATALRGHWLRGMIHYYLGNFVQASALLPEPGPRPAEQELAWVQEVVTLARCCARTGNGKRAHALLDSLDRERLQWASLTVSLPAIRARLDLQDGIREDAEHHLDAARSAIVGLRAQQEERRAKELGSPPYLDVGVLQIAIADVAALLALLGRPAESLALLQPMVRVFLPLLRLIACDGDFASVREDVATRQAFESWLRDAARDAEES